MSAPDLLRTIVAATERITVVRREREPLSAVERRAVQASPAGARFEHALATRNRVNVIAECKRRSPSKGVLAHVYDPVAIARQYERGGAVAISVLTEPTFFDGSLDHLQAVRRAVSLPLLRKDFIVDEYQLFEARAAGADAILLIAAALEQRDLVRLRACASNLGLASLVEVHDETELARAVDAGARIIGVNNRNLRTLKVDVEASYRIAAAMPRDSVAVSESGLQSRADLERLAAAGYRAFLIGERFMTDPDPEGAIRQLIGSDGSDGSEPLEPSERSERPERREWAASAVTPAGPALTVGGAWICDRSIDAGYLALICTYTFAEAEHAMVFLIDELTGGEVRTAFVTRDVTTARTRLADQGPLTPIGAEAAHWLLAKSYNRLDRNADAVVDQDVQRTRLLARRRIALAFG
jgi:indole-3-glycerol phosphate synthase